MSTKVITLKGQSAYFTIVDIETLRANSCKHEIKYKLHKSNRYDGTKLVRVTFSVGREKQTLSFDLDGNCCILLTRDQPQKCIDLLRALHMPTECYIDRDGHLQYSYEHEQVFDYLWDKGSVRNIQREIASLTPEALYCQSQNASGCSSGGGGNPINCDGIPF